MLTGGGVAEAIVNPILNGPFDEPATHFKIGPRGPTGELIPGRRPSESFIPIAQSRKTRGAEQEAFDFDLTGERLKRNTLISDLRREVERWRGRDYERATPISRKLMQHWADPTRENRVFFCQREAAETAIFLAEVAGRHGYTDWRILLDEENATHNGGMPRTAFKMATGSGKTVVMSMLIAWQTLNKAFSPRDPRFTNRFLVITPGITIRDRLRVIRPDDPNNYYKRRDLVPPDLEGGLHGAQIGITNYHAFLPRISKEMKGVSATTRKLLLAGRADDPFVEDDDAVVTRVLRDLGVASSTAKNEIVVINDEAHHCYRDRPLDGGLLSREQSDANDEARVWFRGIQAISRKVGLKRVYDLSATPFYLSGSGYNEGFIFPWTVSDFSLMDAIESGVVKVPRVPVDDDAAGDLVSYLTLWQHVGEHLPRRKSKDVDYENWLMPGVLSGALQSLYQSYERAFHLWEGDDSSEETPPVYIVVCSNTIVSKLVYDWIAGSTLDVGGETFFRPGKLSLFSNIVDGRPLARPRTILIDSSQLESGEGLKGDFKDAAAAEIEAFKMQYRLDHPGADVDKISDEDILREVMNTVGKPGMLGAGVRCVVSVAMLTEGWDANTVTHILGVRAFSSQLLCEQVIGRGLRRRSHVLNDDGHFEAEYANVYGIPFSFIPSDRVIIEPQPRPPALEVRSVEGREHFRITFPVLEGYRIEWPDQGVHVDVESFRPFVIGADEVPTWTESAPIVGQDERTVALDEVRPQAVAFALAHELLVRHLEVGSDHRPWLFPQLVRICTRWITECVELRDGRSIGNLMTNAQLQQLAVEEIRRAVFEIEGQRGRLRAMLRRFDPVGSTANVQFLTRKQAESTTKSEVSHVVIDGAGGNTWEQILALECELNPRIAAFVKNDHLGFAISYVYRGRSHLYIPDFLLRLRRINGEEFDRTLIVEVSGGQKSPGPTREKARTAKESWVPATNNHGSFGRWGYVEITEMIGVRDVLNEAIDNLYADAPITGDPDVLDFKEGHGA
jgi:type III restriction enzyme